MTAEVVTRKVIRMLEGLGHADTDMELDEELPSNGHEGDLDTDEVAEIEADARDEWQGGTAEGMAEWEETEEEVLKEEPEPEKKKIDREIAHEVFHSSISASRSLPPPWMLYTPLSLPHALHVLHLVVLTLWAALTVIAPVDFVRLRVPMLERFYECWLGLTEEIDKHKRRPVTLLRIVYPTATAGIMLYVVVMVIVARWSCFQETLETWRRAGEGSS
ncbi:hypothetical protein MSAN_02107900 [Mycena sanguinolenta]|uniref:Uncharacterized protein n=1 Tax=Mycena sanguinolenta TaxID=230812 RepID=A0A8H6XG16_9AGAR|nr:hypothetical protein MSAN_02107900 [Mycena sanguinolenta]